MHKRLNINSLQCADGPAIKNPSVIRRQNLDRQLLSRGESHAPDFFSLSISRAPQLLVLFNFAHIFVILPKLEYDSAM